MYRVWIYGEHGQCANAEEAGAVVRVHHHPKYSRDVAHFGSVECVQPTNDERNSAVRQLGNQLFAMPVIAIQDAETRLAGMGRAPFAEFFDPGRNFVGFGVGSFAH